MDKPGVDLSELQQGPGHPVHVANDIRQDAARVENKACEDLAQAEGDRLLKAGDEKGGLAALKVAAMLRRRRDEHLGPF